MEKRASFTTEARRTQITQSAIEVLAESGYAATSMSAIADRIQVSKGVLSYHFASKAELLQEVVTAVLASAQAWMIPRVKGAGSYREALRRYIAANVSFLATHRTEIAAVTEVLANARATAGVPELFAKSQAAAAFELQKLFADGAEAGEFGDLAPRILAMSLRATIDATSERLRSDPEFDLDSFEAELVALFDRATAKSVRNGESS